LQHPPAGHGFGCGMPKVWQHGCAGAPQASHALSMQTVFVVAHADIGPTQVFVAGSQQAVDAHAGPEVQQGIPS
jgi:hypothetical protein